MHKYLKHLLLFILTVSFIGPCFTYAQESVSKEMYTANGIPDSLKQDANSIIRYSNDEITINGPADIIIKHHKILTVFNEKGDKEAILTVLHNKKYDTCTDILTRVYDADGKLLKKYHKSDMYDGSTVNDENIVTDDRFWGVKPAISGYPATIEVEYQEEFKSFINLDDWDIQHFNQSVQNETYEILARPEMGFRYDNKNTYIKPDEATDDGYNTYTWHINNLKAIKEQEQVLPWTILPYISFGTNKFNCYGYPGNIDSWQSLGKWIYNLNSDVCTLSPQRAAEIQKMTDTIKTAKAKAKFLYEYLQQNTRYVSIQLGIGGYKPFTASFVDEKKYGDCKALANYMYALLKAVNIPSCWAVVRAGINQPAANPAFPNNQFNHEILCIPFKNDTTWLDCTSTTLPFGKLGPFTENRNALLVTPDGGKLVNTPKSTINDNQFNSEVQMQLDSAGGAKAQVKISCTGVYRDDYVNFATLTDDEQKEIVLRLLNIKQPGVFNFTPVSDNNGIKEVSINLEYDKFCDIIAGDKQFYKPHVFDLCAFTLPVEEQRKGDYFFECPLKKTCVTTIDLPRGFDVENLPPNQSLKFTYGSYEIEYAYNAVKNQITSTAKFIITNLVVPASKYTELQQYLDAVAKSQNKKLIIHKKA